ncbi:unnamed protein product [Ectocarpus sp. CCAP 1310/34]|nr:unnamed protein product [Ectocarpus sp. CCAP 1310/34]
MIVKPCIAVSAAVGLTSSALVGALHASGPGGLPRGARGTATRGGQGMEATGSGFDLGGWFKQAFTPQTAAVVKKKAGTSVAKEKKAPSGRGCTDAVLVLGGTGKTGRKVVEALLKQKRDVVVASRSKESAAELYDASTPGLFSGVDVRDEATLKNKALFEGVTQVVSALGPRFGEEGSSSEAVDFRGVQSAIEAAEAFLEQGDGSSAAPDDEELVLVASGDSGSDERGPGGAWQPLDDVIMGGRSSSAWQKGVGGGVLERQSGKTFGRWAGTLVTEGGGFCGTVIKDMPFDATGYDGIRIRVRGDGSRYKFRLKPDTKLDNTAERQYQAPFDTVKGEWIEVDLPFESFVAVKRNYVDFNAPRVNEGPAGGKMLSLGLVLSRFGFNEYPNPKYTAGAFQLDLMEISLYKKPRPNFVLVSSASAERYHRLTEEERKNDIPIVALNPGGILNWKYKAETSLRKSSLRHCVVRATGLIAEGKEGDESVRLQVGQGDTLSGRVSREEVGTTVAAALSSSYSAGKTFELRRDEAEDATGKTPDFTSLFRGLVLDEDRSLASAGGASLPLPPFAIVQDPPPPVTEERKQEILNDPRVKARTAASKEPK